MNAPGLYKYSIDANGYWSLDTVASVSFTTTNFRQIGTTTSWLYNNAITIPADVTVVDVSDPTVDTALTDLNGVIGAVKAGRTVTVYMVVNAANTATALYVIPAALA